MKKVNIYSHNVCWTRRKKNSDIIASKILQLQPDIVCLQECVAPSQIQKFTLEGYNQAYFQLPKTKVRNTLIRMNREKPDVEPSGGLLTLTKEKPIRTEFIKFQNQGAIFSLQLAERAIQKGFLVVELEDLIIINTHLTAPHRKKTLDAQKIHDNQTDQICNYIKDLPKKVVLVGDFNFSKNDPNFLKLLGFNLRDLSEYLALTFTTWKNKLDYVMINFAAYTSDCRIVNFDSKEPSDHFAIYTEIEYK
jgi:endonuclease/exonuclease/phosphatase family metal-dependent hydrolase